MKDTRYSEVDDKLYLTSIIKDKQWNKFMEIYTLNRIIRVVVNDDAQNSLLSEKVAVILKDIMFRINRAMFCWTLMSVSNLTFGILGFFPFTFYSKKHNHKDYLLYKICKKVISSSLSKKRMNLIIFINKI